MLSLCLHLSSLSLSLLIVAVFVINYSLDCYTNLGLAYIHHSTHILFRYKHLVILRESKWSLVFYTLFELSIGIRAGTLVLVLIPKCDP